jgi:biotin transport system permease protein
MTLAYRPGTSLAHRLDPRTKLAVQAGFAAAAFAHTTPRGLAALTGVSAVVLAAARTSPTVLREFAAVLPFVIGAPLVAGVQLGSPWFDPAAAVFPALVSYRVVLLLLVSGAYVRTTTARESRAALQRTIPGRIGVLAGAGVGFLLRLFPVLQRDLGRIRDAQATRLGTERAVLDRVRLLGLGGLDRVFRRADTFALALQARCFAWNPTLPRLAFGRRDAPALLLGAGLLVAATL